MDHDDVEWVQSREGIYQFLTQCFTNDPVFQFILALLDQNMDRNFKQAELFCPYIIEFKNTLQNWKNHTRVRRQIREDYSQLSQKCNGQKVLSELLKEMAHLITQENQARQMQQSERIRQSLFAQKQFLEEQFLPVQRSVLNDVQDFSETAFYKNLARLAGEYILRDYVKLNNTLTVVNRMGI